MTEFIKRLNDRLNYNSQNIKISKYEYIYISILCLYLVYVVIVSLGWISNPWNNEYREYANTEIVRFIIEGKDVFGGEVDREPYAYLYGPLFAYLTGGFYRLFNLTSDVSVFLRTISGICTVLCGLIGYYEVKRQTKNLFLSLLAFCLILISGWSYSAVSGMPNSFGVLLFLLSLFFGSRDNRAMIILSAIFAALTIYTKQYFACAIVPVAVYLLFKSIKKFYLFAGAFILFFLLSFLVTLNYIPLFWEITFSHHVAAASVNIRHSLWQWGTFILFYFPLVILFILAIVMFIKDRMSCNREMSLTDRLKPLFSLRKNISIYLISAVMMFGVVMVLSLHQGTRMTYFYQLLLPSLAIFSVPYFYIIKNRFLRILMFGCIVIFSLLYIDNRYGFTQYLSGEKLEA